MKTQKTDSEKTDRELLLEILETVKKLEKHIPALKSEIAEAKTHAQQARYYKQ